MNTTLQLLNQHTEKIIRDLAAEHGFDADEAIQKFLANPSPPSNEVTIKKGKGKPVTFKAMCRIDTVDEVAYYTNGGILHYVLRNLAA